jgi:hypothetical protein
VPIFARDDGEPLFDSSLFIEDLQSLRETRNVKAGERNAGILWVRVKPAFLPYFPRAETQVEGSLTKSNRLPALEMGAARSSHGWTSAPMISSALKPGASSSMRMGGLAFSCHDPPWAAPR